MLISPRTIKKPTCFLRILCKIYRFFSDQKVLYFSKFFISILLTLPRQQGGDGISPEEQIDELAGDILNKLQPDFNIVEVMEKYPTTYTPNLNQLQISKN